MGQSACPRCNCVQRADGCRDRWHDTVSGDLHRNIEIEAERDPLGERMRQSRELHLRELEGDE